MKSQDPRLYDPDLPPIRIEVISSLAAFQRLEKLATSDRLTADEWRDLGRPLGWRWRPSGNAYHRETELVGDLLEAIAALELDLEFAEERVEEAWVQVHSARDEHADAEEQLENRDEEVKRLTALLEEKARA